MISNPRVKLDNKTGGKDTIKNHRWLKAILIWLLVVPVFSLLISGCVALQDPEVSQVFNRDILGAVSPEHSMGQTIRMRRPNLSGVTFWFQPVDGSSVINLEITSSPGEVDPLFSTTFQVLQGENHIKIQPALTNPSLSYYLKLNSIQGQSTLFGRDEDGYAHGKAYKDDIPIEGDLAFRTSYAYDGHAVVDDLKSFAGKWLPLISMVLLLVLPGWLVLDGLRLNRNLDAGEQLGLSIGLSLAVLPVLMLWTTVAAFRWSQTSVLISAGAILFLFSWRMIQHLTRLAKESKHNDNISLTSHQFYILLGIFLLSLFIRLAMVRDLTVPPWVDSIHHVLITKGIVQAGGFPNSYLPHIPLEALYYHPGYHSILAFYNWLSGLEISQAMLLFGQVLNSFSVFAIYTLTTTLVKDKTAGLGAAMVTGIFSVMPAYYTSWGRYTQLAGLLILPAALVLLLKVSTEKRKIPFLISAAFTLAGLTIVHYRVAFFTGCLMIGVWLGTLYRRNASTLSRIASSMSATITAGFLSAVLTAPWLVPTISGFILPVIKKSGLSRTGFPGLHWKYFTEASGIPVLILAGLGLLLGLLQRRRFTIILLVWVTLLFITANPGHFHLPFPGTLINQTSVEIMLFVPISICAGYSISKGLSKITSLVPPKLKMVWIFSLMICGVGTALFGAARLLPTLNPVTFLFREGDKAAIEWIEENIPENETVVINPTSWGYGLYMGQDGGYWVSPITNHPTMPPNVLYGLSDKERSKVNHFVEALLPIGENPEEIWQLLNRNGYKTIFIGTRGGVLSPKALSESKLFQVRFHQGTSWIVQAVETP